MKLQKKISLKSIGNENPFSVPEAYFENFALNFDRNILLVDKTTQYGLLSLRWMFSAAAVFFLAIIVGVVFYNNSRRAFFVSSADTYESYVLSQVDESSMIDYYIDQKH